MISSLESGALHPNIAFLTPQILPLDEIKNVMDKNVVELGYSGRRFGISYEQAYDQYVVFFYKRKLSLGTDNPISLV